MTKTGIRKIHLCILKLKILHDTDNDGNFDSPGEQLDTVVTEGPPGVFTATATVHFNSNFGIGIVGPARGIKIDIYTKDVSKIPIEIIIGTAKNIIVGNKTIKVIGLEALIVAKHRAQRDVDIDDLRLLARQESKEINWELLRTIVKDYTEYQNIKTSIDFLMK